MSAVPSSTTEGKSIESTALDVNDNLRSARRTTDDANHKGKLCQYSTIGGGYSEGQYNVAGFVSTRAGMRVRRFSVV